jgi:hypothetical protein
VDVTSSLGSTAFAGERDARRFERRIVRLIRRRETDALAVGDALRARRAPSRIGRGLRRVVELRLGPGGIARIDEGGGREVGVLLHPNGGRRELDDVAVQIDRLDIEAEWLVGDEGPEAGRRMEVQIRRDERLDLDRREGELPERLLGERERRSRRVVLDRLLHDDERALPEVRVVLRLRVELALGDRDEHRTMAERIEIPRLDDLDVVVAPERGLVIPGDEAEWRVVAEEGV